MMPYDPYADPEINTPDDEYPDQVRFDQLHDRIRGRVLSVEKITTRFGPTLKYRLYDGTREVSMLAGSKNLKGAMLEKQPRPGDTLDVELIELRQTANGTAKIFDVEVERGDAATLAPAPRATQQPPDPGRAPAPRPVVNDEGGDIFDQ
jgi:hypothetical protein